MVKNGHLLRKSKKLRQNHSKDMASNNGPEDHYTVSTSTIDGHHYMHYKVFICKILFLWSIN